MRALFVPSSIALILLFATLTGGCIANVQTDEVDEVDGTPKDPTGTDSAKSQKVPGMTPQGPGEEQVTRAGGIEGILACPTEPLPAYGNATATELSVPFARNCATCHGGAGEGGPRYPKIPGKLAVDAYIRAVRSGNKDMPAFDKGFISDAQLAADFDALKSLTKNPGALAATANGPAGWSAQEVEAIYQRGLEIWRKPGSIDKQACTNCHSADGVELAIIGFSDDSILRRGQQHLAAEDALAIRDFIHAQRRRFNITKVCSVDWRPFQPGGRVLPGQNADAQDAAFLAELQKRDFMVATGRVESLADARRAFAQIQAVDIRQLPMGIPLPRWSEDKFNGPEHSDINDYMAPVPTVPNDPKSYFALEDAYLEEPTDATFYRLLDENRNNMNDMGYAADNAIPRMGGNCPGFDNSTDWIIKRMSQPKRQSVLVAAHLFRQELANPGSFYARPLSPFPDAPKAINPAFFLGGFAVEPPCYDDVNYGNWIKSFPEGFRSEFPVSDLEKDVVNNATDRVTHVWMTLGQILDPSLLGTPDMQNNKLHYWAFRNFAQKEVHLPFLYTHRLATQERFWKDMRNTPLFPTATGPFNAAGTEWLHPLLATQTQHSAGFHNAIDPTSDALPAGLVNRFKGNMLRMLMLISRDLLQNGMAIQKDQNDDHCLAVTCQVRKMYGYVADLEKYASQSGGQNAFAAQKFDLDLYAKGTRALLDEVSMLMAAAPRR